MNIPSHTEEMQYKACPEAKGGLITSLLATKWREIKMPAHLHIAGRQFLWTVTTLTGLQHDKIIMIRKLQK